MGHPVTVGNRSEFFFEVGISLAGAIDTGDNFAQLRVVRASVQSHTQSPCN